MNTSNFEKQAAYLREKLDQKVQERAAHKQKLADQMAAAERVAENARIAEQLATAQVIITRYTNHLLDENTDESKFSVVMTLSSAEVSVELKSFVERSWYVYTLTDQAVAAKMVRDFLCKANLEWVIGPENPDSYGDSTTGCYALRAWRSKFR